MSEQSPKRMAPWQLGVLQGAIFAVLIYIFGGISKDVSTLTGVGKAVLAGAVFGFGMTLYEARRQRKLDDASND